MELYDSTEVNLEVVEAFSSLLGENSTLERSNAAERTGSDVDVSRLDPYLIKHSLLVFQEHSFDPDGKQRVSLSDLSKAVFLSFTFV